jgi:hypothetical protein
MGLESSATASYVVVLFCGKLWKKERLTIYEGKPTKEKISSFPPRYVDPLVNSAGIANVLFRTVLLVTVGRN